MHRYVLINWKLLLGGHPVLGHSLRPLLQMITTLAKNFYVSEDFRGNRWPPWISNLMHNIPRYYKIIDGANFVYQ